MRNALLGSVTDVISTSVPLAYAITCRERAWSRNCTSSLTSARVPLAISSCWLEFQISQCTGEIGRAPSELQSRPHLVCRLLLEKKKNKYILIGLYGVVQLAVCYVLFLVVGRFFISS